MSGTLYGLSVGPGDPELITLKAWRLLSLVPVVAYPQGPSGTTLARSIVAPFLADDVTELAFEVPMETERAPARAAYDEAAGRIAAHLAAGRDVACLCEGDALFYGSFMYLFERLSPRHPVVVVPGVSALTAAAAVAGRPLAARNEVLSVIPAPLEADAIRARLDAAQSAAIIKVGRHFDKVRAVLDAAGLAARAVVVEAATRDDQRVTRLADLPAGARPYFSTILVYKGAEPW